MVVRRNAYAGYSIGCAAVWAAILAVAQRRLEPATRTKVALGCAGWWSGWASASIARLAYPPRKELDPKDERRLALASAALVAVGLTTVSRLLAGGTRRNASAAPTRPQTP
jgi:hypothetical protein